MFYTTKRPNPEPVPSQRQESTAMRRPVVNTESKSNTIVSQGCHIKGDVFSADNMSILGKVEGAIISAENNSIIIEKTAQVNTNIKAKVVNINGKIKGNIDASEKITVNGTGHVTGDMSAPKVVLKDGAYFKGNVSMNSTKNTASGSTAPTKK